MNTKIIVGVIIAIAALGGIYFFTMNKNSSVQQQPMVTNTPSPTTMTTPDVTKTTATESGAIKMITLAEVAKHATETDCWMVISDKVYDVTKFIPNHPGGKLIIGGCGKDATKLFNERPTNNKGPHPASAQEALKKLYIGDLQK